MRTGPDMRGNNFANKLFEQCSKLTGNSVGWESMQGSLRDFALQFAKNGDCAVGAERPTIFQLDCGCIRMFEVRFGLLSGESTLGLTQGATRISLLVSASL
jgi:hypothetical protein